MNALSKARGPCPQYDWAFEFEQSAKLGETHRQFVKRVGCGVDSSARAACHHGHAFKPASRAATAGPKVFSRNRSLVLGWLALQGEPVTDHAIALALHIGRTELQAALAAMFRRGLVERSDNPKPYGPKYVWSAKA